MKRFARAYLTVVVIVAVLANLVLIIIYGQNFLFQGAEICSDVVTCGNGFNSGILTTQLIVVNTCLGSFFGLTWLLLKRLQG